MSDRNIPVRMTKLIDQGKETDLHDTTPAERFEMVWPLTVEAWAFKGEDVRESRLQRHIGCFVRRES